TKLIGAGWPAAGAGRGCSWLATMSQFSEKRKASSKYWTESMTNPASNPPRSKRGRLRWRMFPPYKTGTMRSRRASAGHGSRPAWLPKQGERRHECRRGGHECPRHKLQKVRRVLGDVGDEGGGVGGSQDEFGVAANADGDAGALGTD